MKYQLYILAIAFSFFTGCDNGAPFSEFPSQTTLRMETGDYEQVKGKTTEFRKYLTPYGKVEHGERSILFGFIFREIDWIDGVAYMVGSSGEVIDTLKVAEISPPNELWVEMGEDLLLFESGGMIEEGPLPPGRTENEWVDTLIYRVGKNGFELVR